VVFYGLMGRLENRPVSKQQHGHTRQQSGQKKSGQQQSRRKNKIEPIETAAGRSGRD